MEGSSKKHPHTHKGKKFLEKKEGKLVEDTKIAIFMKGHKTSEVISECLKDMLKVHGSNSVNYLRKKHQIQPFEDISRLEALCDVRNSSLFMLGNHTKKRPNNLIIGRMFDSRLLDMIEFSLSQFVPMKNFTEDSAEIINSEIKPMLIFQGSSFEYDFNMMKAKNLLGDMLKEYDVEQTNIRESRRIIVLTAVDETKLIFKHYETPTPTQEIMEGDVEQIKFKELGPSFTMKINRVKFPSNDLYKEAFKKPKIKRETLNQKKNVFTDALGQTKARIHVKQQDISTLALQKSKRVKHKEMEFTPFVDEQFIYI